MQAEAAIADLHARAEVLADQLATLAKDLGTIREALKLASGFANLAPLGGPFGSPVGEVFPWAELKASMLRVVSQLSRPVSQTELLELVHRDDSALWAGNESQVAHVHDAVADEHPELGLLGELEGGDLFGPVARLQAAS